MTASIGMPWKTRLKAWWEGYDLSGLGRRGGDDGLDEPGPSDGPHSDYWSATRIEIVEMVWGKGFHTPGGDDWIPTLIKPFGLDESMSVLDLGAGLGGASRHMALTTGAWITGLEADPVLAHAGMHRSTAAGLEKRAPIGLFDPEDPEFDKRYDAVFSKELMFTIGDKRRMIDHVLKALKPRAHFLFTDYVLADGAAKGPAVTSWLKGEAPPAHPATVSQTKKLLESALFDIRIAEDVTDAYRHRIVTAWEKLSEIIAQRGKADDETQALILAEAESWFRRVAAFDAGALRVYRFYALAP
ncbi:class I SAM-dependent methyltransferase [Inquilinus sp. CAU 1745]|uniref:SAM-dependent methyltransferase n=1 Tax=Inquilinus sp. CAU 1745 TaxID=3140369 RepID=UPI00325A962B